MASNLLGLLRCWEHTALDPRRDSPDLALQNIHAIDSSTKAPGMLYNPNGTVPQGEINMDQHPLIMEKGNAGRVWDPNISRGQERKNKRMKRKSQCTMNIKRRAGNGKKLQGIRKSSSFQEYEKKMTREIKMKAPIFGLETNCSWHGYCIRDFRVRVRGLECVPHRPCAVPVSDCCVGKIEDNIVFASKRKDHERISRRQTKHQKNYQKVRTVERMLKRPCNILRRNVRWVDL